MTQLTFNFLLSLHGATGTGSVGTQLDSSCRYRPPNTHQAYHKPRKSYPIRSNGDILRTCFVVHPTTLHAHRIRRAAVWMWRSI